MSVAHNEILDATLSIEGEAEARKALARRAILYRVLECPHPLAGPSRWTLDGLRAVHLGRVAGAGVARSMHIALQDPRASAQHARLSSEHQRWVIEDLGSKNGTRINGVAQPRALLADGDWIEIGQTHFLFRESNEPAELPLSTALETWSAALAERVAALALIAPTPVPILILGESGTGKEVLARAAHALSRRSGAFVPVNCGAIPASLIEGELFGFKRGAFTGAVEDRAGLIKASERGTLFLDEVGDLSPGAQAALLRVIQEREITPLGGRPESSDLRIVAATNRDLGRLVAKGAFRHDLLARLSGFRVDVPALAERKQDLGLLIPTLLRRIAGARAAKLTVSSAAARALLHYDWPLNVRELEQVLAVAVALAKDGVIEVEHLGALKAPLARSAKPLEPQDAALREQLIAALREHHGNISAVAGAMGKARTQIQRWLKRFELDAREYA